jgi:hypothetical protein
MSRGSYRLENLPHELVDDPGEGHGPRTDARPPGRRRGVANASSHVKKKKPDELERHRRRTSRFSSAPRFARTPGDGPKDTAIQPSLITNWVT